MPQKTIIHTPHAPQAVGPYSQAVQSGNLLFISGQIPIDPMTSKVMLFDGDVAKQCELALKNLQAILQAAGFSLDDIVKTTVYLRSMEDFANMNRMYEQVFQKSRPARATVAVVGLPAGVACEIDAIAARS